MARKAYVCRTCGLEFKAIPGEGEPQECPECESDETEGLDFTTYGGTTEELDFTPRKSRFR
jgi:predicted Zn-ribbon and HTH transcriptional regulator